jgi:hypothetical protein
LILPLGYQGNDLTFHTASLNVRLIFFFPCKTLSKLIREVKNRLILICLASESDCGNRTLALGLFKHFGVPSDRDFQFILSSVKQMAFNTFFAKSPEEFVIHIALHQYGMNDSRDSIS